MTKKLYDIDAYRSEFDATVISCISDISGNYSVVLDQTLFFPEEGGQTPDRGTLGTARVLDVQIDKTGIIKHFTDVPLEAGSTVHGIIDFHHRYSNMQNHTGEHIFSGFAHSRYGCTNVGFHLSDSIVTMDYDKQLTSDEITELETLTNEAIFKNIPVICEYPDAEKLETLDYRSKKELTGDVRIVTIPDVDVCACCAPHVRSTIEVGLLKVISSQNYKGGTRLSILCGERAYKNYSMIYEQIDRVNHLLSIKPEEVSDTVTRLLDERNSLLSQVKTLQEKILSQQVRTVDPDAENVVLFTEDAEPVVMRNTVNALTAAHPGYCGVFNGNDTDGYSFIIGSSKKDCREFLNSLRERVPIKGGGKPEMVQGSINIAALTIKNMF
ncbi:MAG: hypothetical protein K6F39_00450 [Lachnospiraceae bacterium]|nr:hypothetical protein [Lachnospiraceae bacterium]